jgi:hypothetical protein
MIPIIDVLLGKNIGAMTSQEIPVALKEYFVNSGILRVVLYGILGSQIWCSHDGVYCMYDIYDIEDIEDEEYVEYEEYDSLDELCLERTEAELEYYNEYYDDE